MGCSLCAYSQAQFFTAPGIGRLLWIEDARIRDPVPLARLHCREVPLRSYVFEAAKPAKL